VTVVGAGIAGLTAAHELVERGFSVQVVERAADPTTPGPAIGGLARTQRAVIPRPTRDRLQAAVSGTGDPVGSRPRSAGPPADDEIEVAGEHGFRFFPAFYRHLADTMRRTPLLDPSGHPTGRTAWDRLVACPNQVLTTPGQPAVRVRRDAPPSLTQLEAVAAAVRQVGGTPHDAARYLLRMLRFATSCRARRETYQQISGFDFLTLRQPDDPDAGRLPYSDDFLDHLRRQPRALIGLDGATCDALTQGVISLQLLQDSWTDEGPIDAGLDGPTSATWLEPWRHWLARCGVRFFAGELQELLPPERDATTGAWTLSPVVTPSTAGGLDGFEAQADYWVLALDLVSAAKLTRSLSAWGQREGVDLGLIHQIGAYALEIQPDTGPAVRRDPERQPGRHPRDRLQTLSGIQFYLGTRLRLGEDYLYATASPWALTSVAQDALWCPPPSLQTHGHGSILSVDIGDFRHPSPVTGQDAWSSAPDALAAEVWRQLTEASGGSLPRPLAWHLDAHLEPMPGGGYLNHAPYLVPVVGDWVHRPGPEPVDPHHPPPDSTPRHHGYPVHLDALVFAGTWLRTFTRLTTMESANESARHAVNAVLDHLSERLRPAAPPTPAPPPGIPVPTPAGDLCAIWDPQRHEPAALSPWKEVDALLLDQALPHAADLLRVDEIPDGIAPDEEDPVGVALEILAEWLDHERLTEAHSGWAGALTLARDLLGPWRLN